MLFEHGEFMPDQPDFGNPGSTISKNTYPSPRGYKPFGGLLYLSTAMDAYPRGGQSLTSQDGTSKVYAGNDTKLYSLDTGATTDRSKAGGYTSTATFWDFAAYGDIAIATNFKDAIQSINMSSGTDYADLTTDFKARTCAVVRDFLMFGNTNDAVDGDRPERIRWSALGDYTDYTISATTQADFQDTPGGGAVQRIFGGEYAVALFEHSIYRINYVGSPTVFQFDAVETERGLFTAGAAAQNGNIVYYLDSDGFYAFNGSQSSPIGNERVDSWFWRTLDASQAHRISCAVDHDSKCVMWSFPSQTNISGEPTHILIFNYEINKWSYAEIDHNMIIPLLTSDFTLETLDSLNNDIDALDLSVDSRVLFEGSALLGIIESNKLASNQGSPLTAIVESKEMQPSAGRRSHVTEVWPLSDAATTLIQVGTRDRLQDAYTYDTAVAVNAQGFAPVNSEGRYIRIMQTISGDWKDTQGADVVTKQRGRF